MKDKINKLDLDEKVNKILFNQDKIFEELKSIKGEEDQILNEEKILEKEENQEILSLKNIEKLEKKIDKELSHNMKKITYKDVFKSFVGSFVALVAHFVFVKTHEFGDKTSMYVATVLYIASFFIVIIFLYYTGFRNIKKNLLFNFLPKRALLIYFVSLFTTFFVYLLFGVITSHLDVYSVYKALGAGLVPATLGASTADLIGHE